MAPDGVDTDGDRVEQVSLLQGLSCEPPPGGSSGEASRARSPRQVGSYVSDRAQRSRTFAGLKSGSLSVTPFSGSVQRCDL